MFMIGVLIFHRVKISEDCSPYDSVGNEQDCPEDNWRLQILNATNAIVFYCISAVIEIILFTFAVYLTFYIRKYLPHVAEFLKI